MAIIICVLLGNRHVADWTWTCSLLRLDRAPLSVEEPFPLNWILEKMNLFKGFDGKRKNVQNQLFITGSNYPLWRTHHLVIYIYTFSRLHSRKKGKRIMPLYDAIWYQCIVCDTENCLGWIASYECRPFVLYVTQEHLGRTYCDTWIYTDYCLVVCWLYWFICG